MASSFDVLTVVWHPSGQAGGMAPADHKATSSRGDVILGACPSGEDLSIGLCNGGGRRGRIRRNRLPIFQSSGHEVLPRHEGESII